MDSKPQMKRGLTQSLYKYLPESWIDFSVRGNERKNYIAKVTRWNSEKLEDINKERILRIANKHIKSFEVIRGNGILPATTGFGDELTKENCQILCPKNGGDERGVVAKISPLTFYCPQCKHICQFHDEGNYFSNRYCKKCHVELKQIRQIYFCKCGGAIDQHMVFCDTCKNGNSLIWDVGNYNFICQKCKRVISMHQVCPTCKSRLSPKVALDPSQFFVHNFNLIDIINQEKEAFVKSTNGPFIAVANWCGDIKDDDVEKCMKNHTENQGKSYETLLEEQIQNFVSNGLSPELARSAAKIIVEQNTGKCTDDIVKQIKMHLTSLENTKLFAESFWEYHFLNQVKESSTLQDAKEIAKKLNTSANPDNFEATARKYGIISARVCGEIPFISCSYGYTRVKSEPEEGVVLRAFQEEKRGTKNIYAAKLKTEGVLFEFDRERILEWLKRNEYVHASLLPQDFKNEHDVKLWFVQNVAYNQITTFSRMDPLGNPNIATTFYIYTLIHSLSHLLIRSAATMCGLDKNSLSEYIFPGIPAVLIYCQNSQGFNLGALFNLFEAYFDKWLDKANEMAKKCIFDPICIEGNKACTGCLFLNEISCQHFNHDLDRSLVIGSFDRKTKIHHWGFWEE